MEVGSHHLTAGWAKCFPRSADTLTSINSRGVTMGTKCVRKLGALTIGIVLTASLMFGADDRKPSSSAGAPPSDASPAAGPTADNSSTTPPAPDPQNSQQPAPQPPPARLPVDMPGPLSIKI